MCKQNLYQLTTILNTYKQCYGEETKLWISFLRETFKMDLYQSLYMYIIIII